MSNLKFSSLYYDILVDYQKRAVEEILSTSLSVLGATTSWLKNKNNFLLEAPTGSGKTIITGVFIDSLFKNVDNVSIVWLCETPSLTNQSKLKLEEILGISGYDYDEINQERRLPNHSVTYINWEKTKNDTNKARSDAEATKSIDTLIKNTKEEGTFVVFIIDEAHIHTNSKKSSNFLQVCSPDLILEVTATPTKSVNTYDFPYTINIEDVEDAGFIKQGIIINDEKDLQDNTKEYQEKYNLKDLKEFILHKSYLKRNEIENAIIDFSKQGNLKSYVPLLAIQLPNNNDDIQKDVEIFFQEKFGLDRTNGLAVYTSKDYTDELDIISKDENTKVLLFKQAIAKGWDCPRASVLTFIRDPKSHNFTVQTIGRIMRMPYLRQFARKYDFLNYGYVYIEESDNNVLINYRKQTGDNGHKIPTSLKEKTSSSDLVKLVKVVWEDSLNKGRINVAIEEELKKMNWSNGTLIDINKPFEKKILSDAKSTISLFKDEEVELNQKEMSNLTKYDIQTIYNKLSNKAPLNKDIIKVIESDLRLMFDERKRQEIILANLDVIIKEVNLILNKEKQKCPPTLKYLDWETPLLLSFNSKLYTRQSDFDDKFLYNECWLNVNGLESNLVKQLHNDSNVLWWFKNGDHGEKFFSLAYELNSQNRLFFPDFLIETNHGIYILETKGKLNEEETIVKASILRKYQLDQSILYKNINIKPITAGIVTEHNGESYIYQGSDYSKEYADIANKWQKLTFK